jgi:hypothetical protein
MPQNPTLSLWPELDPPQVAKSRNSRATPAAAALPALASAASTSPEPPARAPIKFCAYGGLTPWKRDYGTGRAICSRCARQKEAAGCPVLGNREIECYQEPNPAPRGFTGRINPVGL